MPPAATAYSDTRLIGRVLYHFYVENRSQTQIARDLGLSVSKVNRLIKKGREQGMVEISVQMPFQHLYQIERKIEQLSQLNEAVVVPNLSEDEETSLNNVGQAAAEFLLSRLRDGDTICMSGGRAIASMIDYINPKRKYAVCVIPAIGGVQGRAYTDVNFLAAELARRLGGIHYQLHAPAFVDSKSEQISVSALRNVKEILELAKQAQIALVGIGSLVPMTSSYFQFTSLSSNEVEQLISKFKGVGQILAHTFKVDGTLSSLDFSNRVVGMTLNDLKKIPVRIGVAGLKHKAQAITGALRGDYANTLITDESTANEVTRLLKLSADK